MAYTSNVTGYETLSSGYSVRGFDADVQLRNGFRRIGLPTIYTRGQGQERQ